MCLLTNTCGPHDDHGQRQACRRVVQRLMDRYQWTLIDEAELTERVLSCLSGPVTTSQIERLIKQHYTPILYAACRHHDQTHRERGYAELLHYLCRVARPLAPEQAEDLAQHALLLVVEQLDRCRAQGAFLAFVLHKLLAARKQFVLRARPAQALDADAEGAAGQADGGDGALLDQERRQLLWQAVDRLDDQRQQQAVILKFWGGLNDTQIGTQLQITPNHVRVLRHRALAQLRNNEELRAYFVPSEA